jgi:uncharacterized protein YjbI with pentapeptide repeats
MTVKRIVMHRTLLRSAVLNMMFLEDADLSEADLRNTRFHAVFMTNVNLSGADLRSADLSQMALNGVDLRRANLLGIKYSEITLQFIATVNLEGAKMSADLQKDIEKIRSG